MVKIGIKNYKIIKRKTWNEKNWNIITIKKYIIINIISKCQRYKDNFHKQVIRTFTSELELKKRRIHAQIQHETMQLFITSEYWWQVVNM